jgi:hypothetical protein
VKAARTQRAGSRVIADAPLERHSASEATVELDEKRDAAASSIRRKPITTSCAHAVRKPDGVRFTNTLRPARDRCAQPHTIPLRIRRAYSHGSPTDRAAAGVHSPTSSSDKFAHLSPAAQAQSTNPGSPRPQ